MATENTDDADITCKNPNCPKGIFKWNTILKHVSAAKKCKTFYHEEEIQSMRDDSKNKNQSRKIEKKRKENNPAIPTTSGKQNFAKAKDQCKICKKMFVNLLTHLNQTVKCKRLYGNDYNLLKLTKEQQKKEYRKEYKLQSQFKDSRSQANADYYLKNKKEIREKMSQRYFAKKKAINKNKSLSERIKSFKRDIVHGPNYACFSCKRSLFKSGVRILKPKDVLDLITKLSKDFCQRVGLHRYKTNNTIACHNC